MKKYKVTEKHELLKENVILEFSLSKYINSAVWAHEFSEDEITSWLESGWIEEIQEPEFTRNDMIDFLNYFVVNDNHNPKNTREGCEYWFKSFIKFRKNKADEKQID